MRRCHDSDRELWPCHARTLLDEDDRRTETQSTGTNASQDHLKINYACKHKAFWGFPNSALHL